MQGQIGLVYVKEQGRPGFSRDCRAALRDFPRAKPWGSSEEDPCQPKENPVLPDSFPQINITFLKVSVLALKNAEMVLCLPKMHIRFCIGSPKIHLLFCIGTAQVSLNFLPQEFHRQGIMLTIAIAIMKDKQQNNLFKLPLPHLSPSCSCT